eukprot:gene11056-11211_t
MAWKKVYNSFGDLHLASSFARNCIPRNVYKGARAVEGVETSAVA